MSRRKCVRCAWKSAKDSLIFHNHRWGQGWLNWYEPPSLGCTNSNQPIMRMEHVSNLVRVWSLYYPLPISCLSRSPLLLRLGFWHCHCHQQQQQQWQWWNGTHPSLSLMCPICSLNSLSCPLLSKEALSLSLSLSLASLAKARVSSPPLPLSMTIML